MRRILFISMLLLFLCVSSFGIAEIAFDNHRQGFIIGGLGGIAVNTWVEYEYYEPDYVKVADGTNIALHIDLRIGGGFKGDKFLLYNWFVMNLFGGANYVDKLLNRYLTFNFIWGPGVSYYFKPTSPSLYISAGIGFGTWGFWTTGAGATVGIGYEFIRHWSVECGVMYGYTGINYTRVDYLAISLSIIGIAY